jgi:hypothetical protein
MNMSLKWMDEKHFPLRDGLFGQQTGVAAGGGRRQL